MGVVNIYTCDLLNINTTFNNVVITASSQAIQIPNARNFVFNYRLRSSGTPTSIKFTFEFAKVGVDVWYALDEQFFARLEHEGTEVAGTGKRFCVTGPCVGERIRVTVDSTGTTALNTFTLSEAHISFKD